MKVIFSRSRFIVGIAVLMGIWLFSSVTTVFYELSEEENSPKYKLLPRHKTTFEIRGTNYIFHKKSYDRRNKKHFIQADIEKRQRLTEEWRPHLMAKRGMLGLQQLEDLEVFRQFHPKDVFEEKCDSCAIVSNTDLLLGSSSGAQIDRTDCVVRFGTEPTKYYAADIGTKTTIRLMKKDSFKNSTIKDAKNVFINDCESNEVCQKLEMKRTEQKTPPKIFYFTENGHTMAKSMFDAQNLASGHNQNLQGPSQAWYSLMIIKRVGCKKVNMHGFPPPYFCRNKKNRTHRLEYWRANSERICSGAKENSNNGALPSLEEKKLLLQWAWKYKLNFQNPEW